MAPDDAPLLSLQPGDIYTLATSAEPILVIACDHPSEDRYQWVLGIDARGMFDGDIDLTVIVLRARVG